MSAAPNIVVAGHRDLARRLRATGRFPAVFDVASATELRNLSKSGQVDTPAAFIFAPEFDEDLPDARVPLLANRLAASGFTVLVHAAFTARGDVFDPGVVARTEPMTLAELLKILETDQPDLQPEPPPDPWEPSPTPVRLPHETAVRPEPAAVGESHPPSGGIGAETEEAPCAVPGYGEPSVLHRGTGSVTYRAVHEVTGKVAAIRVRHDGSETPASELAALERASRSDHVVTVLESGHTMTGQFYTASVHCPGAAHEPGPPLPVPDAVGIAVSIGRGLQALHDEGLVHGDVHPGRILHGPQGPLLTGAATLRGLAEHSIPGVLEPVGLDRIDAGFAAPEALRHEPQTARSDVHGLGATLWCLLAGHPPFGYAAERTPDAPAPRLPRDDVPDWLASIVEKAMAGAPADRYPTAGALADALMEGPEAGPVRLTDGSAPADRTWEERLSGLDRRERSVQEGREAPMRSPVRRRVLRTIAALVFAGTAIGVAVLLADSDHTERPARAQSPAPSTAPAPTATPTAVRPAKKFTPAQVRIVDSRVSIEIRWRDASEGRAAHYVVGGPQGRTPSTLASAPAGASKVVVKALNPGVEYCLTVVAVVDVDHVAYAEPVCTHRGRREG